MTELCPPDKRRDLVEVLFSFGGGAVEVLFSFGGGAVEVLFSFGGGAVPD